ncbi:hypothetical protein_gp125 [Bacillus phage vB_BceM_WH1]|nr:hypothetical protein_gp125 [Bacillus phage vB_BceM_WH1]
MCIMTYMEIQKVFWDGQNRFCHQLGIQQPYGISRKELCDELKEHVKGEDMIKIWEMVMGWWFPSRIRTQYMKNAFVTSSESARIRAYNFNMYLLNKWEGRTDEHL